MKKSLRGLLKRFEMKGKHYRVGWNKSASAALAKLFNIDPNQVFKRSKYLLSTDPYAQTYGVAESPGFEFNGHSWTLIHNVILIYHVSEEENTVLVEACYYANTKESHEVFWGIDPEDE
jgi:hypothetical protein